MVVIALFGFVWFPGIRAPLSFSFFADLGGACLVFLVLVNLWSCLLAESAIRPRSAASLRGSLCALRGISVLFFSELSLLKFYIYFEISLIPIFLIIIGWGYQIERLGAAKAIILYTIRRSLPLFLLIILSITKGQSVLIGGAAIGPSFRRPFSVAALLAFLVKLPIFFFHIWLPKAHVEAPVVGSIFLAAILLKLGGFGLVKIKRFVRINLFISSGLSSVRVWSFLLVRALCTQTTDIKVLIAFSSVAHMAFILLLLRRGPSNSIACLYLVLVSHGISSSGGFFYSFLIYKVRQTRSILLNKGRRISSGLSLVFWGLICVGIIGGPPSFNLWVEICSFIVLIPQLSAGVKLLFWGALLGGAYSFFLIASPISYNGQFLFWRKKIRPQADLIHLIQVSYTLIRFSFLCPLLLFWKGRLKKPLSFKLNIAKLLLSEEVNTPRPLYSLFDISIQEIKSWVLVNSNLIGINLWLAPQISEHWP